MSAQTPAPTDSPVMIAWEAYKMSDEFQNVKTWAVHLEHVEGSLWEAFNQGYAAANSVAKPETTQRTDMGDSMK